MPAEVLTALGWLSGTLHVPAHLQLVEYLALGTHALKFTGVGIPNESDRLTFVALRRESMILVAPTLAEDSDTIGASEYTTAREVACLLPMGMLRGTLRVIYNLRLSDHLQQEGRFLTLRHCLVAPYGGTAKSSGARTLGNVIVNLDHTMGISECT